MNSNETNSKSTRLKQDMSLTIKEINRIKSEIKESEQSEELKFLLKQKEEQLNKLRWQYDQLMLSQLVKGEDSKEVGAWWINRY